MLRDSQLLCGWTPPSRGVSLTELDEGKRAVIFDSDSLIPSLKLNFNNKLVSDYITSSSFKESCESISASMNASGSTGSDLTGKFAASVAAAYRSNGQSRTSASMTQYTRLAIFGEAQVQYSGLVERGGARDFLNPSLREVIDSLESDDEIRSLFSEIGFFFPFSVQYGAALNLSAVYEATSSSASSSMQAKFSAQYRSMAASVNGTGTIEMNSSESQATSNVHVRISNNGGSISELLNEDENAWLLSAAAQPVAIRAKFFPTYHLGKNPDQRSRFKSVWLTMRPAGELLEDGPAVEVCIRPGRYRILSKGGRAIEAFPKDEFLRPRDKSSDHDQIWSIQEDGRSFKLMCNTTNRGARYMEAFPNENRVKPAPGSNDPDQLWYFRHVGGSYFKICCDTRNQGTKVCEFVHGTDHLTVRVDSSNENQLFRFESI